MGDSRKYSKRAFSHIQYLVEQIGPRPAGSINEQRAIEYVKNQLKGTGYAIETQPVLFAPHPRIDFLYLAFGFVLLFGSIYFEKIPLAAVFLPVLFLLLPTISQFVNDHSKTNSRSSNVLVTGCGNQKKPSFLLCAHVDSARSITFKSEFLIFLYAKTAFFIQRVAYFVSLIAILLLIGLELPEWMIFITKFVGGIAGLWLILVEVINQIPKPRYSKGAHDNASGVGVLLALAEWSKEQNFQNIQVEFLFTGAEETGLHGAKSYILNRIPSSLPHYALNIDMVGGGDKLYYVFRDGLIFQRDTSARLNSVLKIVIPGIMPYWNTLRSGDYLPFLKAGIHATSIQTGGCHRIDLIYHTELDQLNRIDGNTIHQVVTGVQNWLMFWENNLVDSQR